MLGQVIRELLEEVALQKKAQETRQELRNKVEEYLGSKPKVEKISSADEEYIKARLSLLGLGKYAAYVDANEITPVAAELIKSLLDEMEKMASKSGYSFRVSEKPDLSNVDPITKFALGVV